MSALDDIIRSRGNAILRRDPRYLEKLFAPLLAGPVRDFNLMVRRGKARGSIVVCRDRADSVATADAGEGSATSAGAA